MLPLILLLFYTPSYTQGPIEATCASLSTAMRVASLVARVHRHRRRNRVLPWSWHAGIMACDDGLAEQYQEGWWLVPKPRDRPQDGKTRGGNGARVRRPSSINSPPGGGGEQTSPTQPPPQSVR